jgi:macrolide transport system ATP-binding/permease protein
MAGVETNPLIEVEGLSKVYDLGEQKIEALKSVSLKIFPGEMVALMGPSGSGKSTLMNLLGCLDKPTGGRYRLLGHEVSELSADAMAGLRNHEIGFVFQNYNLLSRTTALENAELPMLYNGYLSVQGRENARKLLDLVGLGDRADHRPNQLSGGQQQRVAIARALRNDPQIILADEPTGNLDTKTGHEIIQLFEQLNREKAITIIFVTHDPDVARHGQRIIYFKDGVVEREEVQDSARPHVSLPRAPRAISQKKSLAADIATNVRIALRALKANKLRSALTMLGVIIGVGAVIAMVAIGQGAKARVAKQMERLGSNRLTVYAGAVTRGGRRMGGGSITTLTEADAQAILSEVPGVELVAPTVQGSAQVVYGNSNWLPAFLGTTTDYFSVMNWGIQSGSDFTEEDVRSGRKVALIGKTVAKELFGDHYPIGQVIRMKHIPFEVVGVLKERGTSSFAGDLDDVVVVPLRTAQRKLLGIRYVRRIEVSAASGEDTGQMQAAITELLRKRHRLTSAKVDDFMIRDRTEIIEAANEAASTLSYLLAGIASVALIVGGIGIMNIMLVSVTERTREIGLRLAVGARRRDIRRQFLTEAVVLSLLGGTIGVIVGVGASLCLSYFAQWEIVISSGSLLLAFLFSAAIGVFFGFQPAERAARLNPIEALRYE